MKAIGWMVCVLLGCAVAVSCDKAPTPPEKPPSPAERLADAYGLAAWNDVERIEFTFNAKLPGRDDAVRRQWAWAPGSDAVTFTAADGQMTAYNHGQVTDDVRKIDGMFVNDSYWLLFPFQAAWSRPTVEVANDDAALPIGEGDADEKWTVRYATNEGYTGGDAYVLYLKHQDAPPRLRIAQWEFLRGGDADKARPATWDKHVKLGPIVVATEHRDAAGTFRLWFDGLRLKLRGDETWHEPTSIE